MCAILHEIQAEIDEMPIRNSKGIIINKVIDAMINHKVTSRHEVISLIQATCSTMYHIYIYIYNKYKGNGESCWRTIGRPPIMANNSFYLPIKKMRKTKTVLFPRKACPKF